MVTSSSNKQADSSQFSLKHRLIGAGILISFGVLILPWLLGSYSAENAQALNDDVSREAKPSSIASLVSKAGNKTVGEQGDDKQGSSEIAKNADQKPEVKVFKSRVQPIQPVAKENVPTKPKSESKKKATTVKPKSTEDNKSKQKVAKKADPAPTKKVEKPKAAQKKTEAAKPKNATVTPGYIVSVGVFGDAKNVENMVADLKSKQFAPEVRKETFKTKSVSRIYMGPYSTRAEAGKIKLRLSEKGINKTLIKAFP